MRQTFDKLVRDGIPARLEASGVEYEARIASPTELRALLLAKLQEEVGELLGAADDADAVDEMADIREILAALATQYGADEEEMRVRQCRKREARGGFDRGIVLRWTEIA